MIKLNHVIHSFSFKIDADMNIDDFITKLKLNEFIHYIRYDKLDIIKMNNSIKNKNKMSGKNCIEIRMNIKDEYITVRIWEVCIFSVIYVGRNIKEFDDIITDLLNILCITEKYSDLKHIFTKETYNVTDEIDLNKFEKYLIDNKIKYKKMFNCIFYEKNTVSCNTIQLNINKIAPKDKSINLINNFYGFNIFGNASSITSYDEELPNENVKMVIYI